MIRLAMQNHQVRRLSGASIRRSFSQSASKKSTEPPAKESVPIISSLAAAFVGIGAVSATASLIESSTVDSCLPYSEKGQRYDQDTFAGRFCRMILACDPFLLIYTEEQVREAQSVLERTEQYKNDRSMDRELWEAKRIIDAAVHPDTKEFIPRPFRMSGYVPYNGPICVSMVASTSTLPILFWSWLNQSQNALVNYYNRNAASPMTNETLMKSYTAAVGSALVVAFGLATFIQKRYSPTRAKELMKFVAFPSAIVASSLNCYIVRSPEIETGVPLLDGEGNNVFEGETSTIAARHGVYSTTLSRALLQAPVYFLPPLLLSGPLQNFVKQRPTIRVPLTTFLILTAFGIGLPATVALFPQIVSITPEEVEPKYQHLKDPKTREHYIVYYYNKGL
ncbi:MAG: hypothetical protein SGBAC_001122 [Bacillariaceae sp.]